MKIKNIIDSITCVDFLNKIDNLIFKLLYEPNKGYYTYQSKEAIDLAENFLEDFDKEIEILTAKFSLCEAENLIEEKRKEYVLKIKEHYFKQSDIWADEVYSNLIDNCLTLAYINKNDKNMLDKIYNRGLCAISWISSIKKFSEENKNDILKAFKENFSKTIKSKNDDNILNKQAEKTNPKTFLKLYLMISENEKDFLNLKLNDYESELTKKDIMLLSTIQSKLKSFRRSETKDEIALISTSFKILGLDDSEKYDFLTQVDDDFRTFFSLNKKIEENDKIAIVKRRMEIFKNSRQNYYKKLLNKSSTSLSE